ncbi:hypothetical protein MUK42_30737 [Musa troglodytarum]|uniref:VLRF1 domain-containing protein n=1 Tax=Musa troglodytarum TaxID=320322 RepID=A0A9E7JYM1_9LILI|nr:hypothetical protein MUK42_30737 [Musa troglodytarum]
MAATEEKSLAERKPRSVFDLPPGFFDSCRLLRSLQSETLRRIPDPSPVTAETGVAGSVGERVDVEVESVLSGEKGKEAAASSSRWTCNTCKAEFDSLQDQRSHFKSDLHRLNVKLSIAGKNIIKEDDFDNLGGDLVYEDFDVSSISGSEDEYVVRAKAGKRQSAKDATGKAANSAGSSLRRYNEAALKKEIQELLVSWKPFIDSSPCIFIHAPSRSRQMFFDGEKPQLSSQDHKIRHVPSTVRRPTFKEAVRIYQHLTSLAYEVAEDHIPEEDTSSRVSCEGNSIPQSNDSNSSGHLEIKKSSSGSGSGAIQGLAIAVEAVSPSSCRDETTPLHEAAKCGDSERTLELLEQGLNPCIKDGRGRTPYMLASEKEVRNTFRRFMGMNPDKWDWHAANVPSPLTKEIEEAQAAKQAEKDAKRKAKAKELKKLRKAKEKAKAQAAVSENASAAVSHNQGASASAHRQQPQSNQPVLSKEVIQRKILDL